MLNFNKSAGPILIGLLIAQGCVGQIRDQVEYCEGLDDAESCEAQGCEHIFSGHIGSVTDGGMCSLNSSEMSTICFKRSALFKNEFGDNAFTHWRKDGSEDNYPIMKVNGDPGDIIGWSQTDDVNVIDCR